MTGERRTTEHLENRNSEDIVELRREYKNDISGIHERIDQIFDVLRRNKPTDYKATLVLGITLFVTVIFSLGTILQIQIGMAQDYQSKIQDYSDAKNDSEHEHLSQDVKAEADEILRIRLWKDEMEQLVPEIRSEGKLLKERIDKLENRMP